MEAELKMPPIRILLVTQLFDPEPTFKGLVFARELVRQGFDVEVVTGYPNYPGGKIYPGYRQQLLRWEIIDGVRIARVPLFPSHSQSKLGRILNYLSFACAALIFGLLRRQKPDVIYAYHPPLTVGVSVALLRLIRRVPVVYDIQDMWPDTLRATGMFSNPTGLRIVGHVCQWVYRHVDHLVVLSPGFKRLLVERGVPGVKVDVIPNWCDEAAMNRVAGTIPVGFPDSSRFRLLFAGNLGKAQAMEAVLDAASLWRERAPALVLVLLGSGIELVGLKARAEAMRLENVVFMSPVPMADVGSILHAADALLVHLKANPLFAITIPSKTQAYLAVGKPILMAVHGDAAALIEESGGGVVAIPEYPTSIAAAAVKLMKCSVAERDSMAECGQRYYREKLSLAVGVRSFGLIFQRLATK